MDHFYKELGAFPVHRGERDAWAFDHAMEVLSRGLVLGMFPEGTRSKGHGLRPAKTGAARLAIGSGAPILPVALFGTQTLFKKFPTKSLIHVRFGELVHPFPNETALALTDRVMFEMARMLPPSARGAYLNHPVGF
jgi:1-acyl-sn-glycerol-3-phosphate acyltransferase